jgi:hypothetical protein
MRLPNAPNAIAALPLLIVTLELLKSLDVVRTVRGDEPRLARSISRRH